MPPEKITNEKLPGVVIVAHKTACTRGHEYYVDPITGLSVFTRLKLLDNGSCCGTSCRHCPYSPKAQKGNVKLAPYSPNSGN